MVFSEQTLILYLNAAMLFCWVAVMMARAGEPFAGFEISKRKSSCLWLAGTFAVLITATAMARVYHEPLDAVSRLLPDLVFPCLAVICAAAALIAARDSLSSVGLSPRGIELTLFFLVPPAALVFLRGHIVNLKVLASGIGLVTVAAAFAEELFFRGYLQTRLQAFYGSRVGLLAAAAAYASFRGAVLWGLMPPVALAVNLTATFIMWGCVAGMIYRRAGNIYGLVVLHVFWSAATRAFAGMAIY